MTFREKLKKDTGRGINCFGCPSDHKYEERRSFKDHCSCISCCDCWDREIETECVDGTDEVISVERLCKGDANE